MALPIAIVTPSPATVNRSTLAPATAVTFDGTTSTPGTGGVAIVGYAWTLIDIPATSLANWSSTVIGTPDLQSLDTYGNYLGFLVVTDDVGGVSETDWRKAPSTAFALVQVPDDVDGTMLQLCAAGERNWYTADRDVTLYVEALKVRIDNFVVQDLADVASPTTTGPNLDFLTDGSYATDTGAAGGVALHLHEGATIDVATTVSLGVVELAEAPVNPAAPKAVTQDKIRLTAYVGESDQSAGVGTAFGLIGPAASTTANAATSLCAFRDTEDLTLDQITIAMADSGTIAGGGYVFKAYKILTADWIANNYGAATLLATVTIPAPAANNAGKCITAAIGITTDARYVVAVVVDTAPALAADQGGRITVEIEARKKW